MEDAYEVYAVRYARRDSAVRGEHFYRHDPDCCAEPMPIDYFVWAAVSARHTVVLDAGFTPASAARRGRTHLASPVDTLARVGVAAGDVAHLVLSHLHYDHTGYLEAFPAATAVVQQRELRFWTGPHAARGEYPQLCEPDDVVHLVRRNLAGGVRQVDGDAEVAPGVTVHLVGGHTPGMQVLRVRTRRGHAVLAADASHFYANIEGDRPFSIVDHLPSMYDAFDRIRDLADDPSLVVPGHDPLVGERADPVPGTDGLVLRIA